MQNGPINSPKSKRVKKIIGSLAGVVVLAVAFFLGAYIQHLREINGIKQVVGSIKPIRENNFNYKYVFPLLSYDFSQANQYLRDNNLNSRLNNFVAQQIKQGNAQNISVYIRNLIDNSWAGVNEDQQYHPGSMLKVLIMMAYYREAELDPTLLNKTLLYSSQTNQEANAVNFSAPSNLTVGQSYGINKLLEDMIAESDNGAETLLLDNVDHKILNNAYDDLGIQNPDSATTDYTISPKQFSSFLRILYNSTYLTEQYSEQALTIMDQSTFKDGLEAGVPSNLQVSHKYGERVDNTDGNVQAVELHDCGIIYAPNHPYSICVMTKGLDEGNLKAVIKGVSNLVYKEFIPN